MSFVTSHQMKVSFGDAEGFCAVRDRIHGFIRSVLRQEQSIFEVALNEAVNNALAHGLPEDKQLLITIKLNIIGGNRLIIRVKDNGPGFCVATMAKELDGCSEVPFIQRLTAESGRGLLMMKALADYMRYNRQGNEILLMKKLGTSMHGVTRQDDNKSIT